VVADFMAFSHHLPHQLRVRLDFFTDQEKCRWRLAGLENREELFCLPWYWPIIEGQCNCLVGWGSGPQQRGSANLNIEGGRDHLLNPLFSLDHLIENKKAEDKKKGGGSRFLYDSFDAAQARIDAHERVMEERWTALEFRLAQIDGALERLEKRLWLGVYGVAAFLLAQGAEALLKGTA